MSATNDPHNYYSLLNVSTTATEEDIRRAYRREALQCHPDKPNGDATRFKSINEAYQVLSSPSARAQYDAALKSPKIPHHHPHPHSHSPFPDPFMVDPFAHFHFAFRNADEVFRSVFGSDFGSINGMQGFGPSLGHRSSPMDPMGSSFGHGLMNPFSSMMTSQSMMFPSMASSTSSRMMHSTSQYPNSSFFSTSTSRTVDAQGNVIEESVTVDGTGKRTVHRTVNGVPQPMSQTHSSPRTIHHTNSSSTTHYLTSNTSSGTTTRASTSTRQAPGYIPDHPY